jgi:hypothetical protein
MRSVRPTLRWMGWQYKSACASQDNCVCARGLTVPCCCPPALTAQPSGSPLCDHHRHSEQCHAQSTLWCCRGHPTLVSSVAWQQGVRPTERTDSMPARGDNELHATALAFPKCHHVQHTHNQPFNNVLFVQMPQAHPASARALATCKPRNPETPVTSTSPLVGAAASAMARGVFCS